jgi:hypothetical protein
MHYGGHVIKGDIDAIHFNPVPSSISKWRAFKLLRWIQNFHQLTWDHGILYADRSSKDGQPLMRPFLFCPTAILHLHVVYSVFSDKALAAALYTDIHAPDYAVLTSSMQTTVFKSPINGTFLLSFVQHC